MPHDDPDPPRKFYGFKTPEFERANPVPPAPQPDAAAAPDPGPARAGTGSIDVRDLASIAAHGADSPLGSNAVQNRPNEVHEMLQLNLERENAAGLNRVALPRKRLSRRKRDYWLLMGVGNAIFGGMAIRAGLGNPVLLVYSIAGIGAFSAGLTWVMWQIMDDY